MMPNIEKRLDERADVMTYAKYKILSDNEGATASGYEEGTTRNISKGGLCMQVPRKLNEGNVIRIEIPTVEDSDRVIKAFCEVQWCVKDSKGDIFDTGLSFIALKEEDIEYLNDYVKKQNRVM